MICTLYSHEIGFDKITNTLKNNYPKAVFTIRDEDDSQVAEMEFKEGFLGSSSKLTLLYRQRNEPSYQIPNHDDSPLTANLRGLYGYVDSLPSKNENIKGLFLHKIETLNSEFSISQEKGKIKDLKELIGKLAQDFDAVLFVQPNIIISKSDEQHF